MEEIRPLSRQQQIFLQRFFAMHVLTERQAQSLFEETLQLQQRNELGRDVKDTFKRINRSLTPAFRLEIKSVSLALPMPNGNNNSNGNGSVNVIGDGIDIEDDGDNDYTSSRATSQSQSRQQQIIYHTIVNCDSDEVAKTAANPTFTKSPHEFAFLRLLLERFIEKDMSSDEHGADADHSSSSTGKGCRSSMSRIDMINLRLSLTGPHEGKLSIGQAENVLDLLEVQGWFVPASPPPSEADESMSSPGPSRRSRRSGPNRTNGAVGGGAKYLQIGPRSYLEFPDFLIKVGLDNNKLPQFLVHG